MIRVTHVIDGLSVGGAEVMLASLVHNTDPTRFRSEVISLTDIGLVGQTIAARGTPVRSVGMHPSALGALRAARLLPWIRSTRPDIVQTWLYHGDLLGGLAARITTRSAPVVWGVHRSDLDPGWTKRRLAVAARLCARVSHRVPTRVICPSEDAARRHVELGYDPDRMVIIPNGYELDAFAPDDAARASVREELGVAPDARLVGMMARFDPQKDHRTMVRAATIVIRSHDAHVVLCGQGVDWANPAFAALVEDQSIRPNLHLLGLRPDVARIDAALDVGVLSSIGGEAFPLAIGEMMACGVPCVVTDVGDAGVLVGDTGTVVRPGDPAALAAVIGELLDRPDAERRALGAAARARVHTEYAIDKVVKRYEDLYDELVSS
ncbi:MAG: hypothetical protein QOI47_1574 [Actinomycetota bacterium]|jgi:glycosyltransferase involved in cell wall biosynthesis|nr:hypothetical protein [Actinomycetota bacterium]